MGGRRFERGRLGWDGKIWMGWMGWMGWDGCDDGCVCKGRVVRLDPSR